MRIALCCALGVLLLTTGCATQKEIASQAEKGSLATEDANNRLMLLNVVRAYHRYPMHFVRFNSLRGPIGIGAPTVTVPTPFGPDFTSQIYNVSTTIKFDQPSFDLQLLDTQDFYRGLMAPIKPDLMQYFLEQGWPQQLILYLFVREIETFAADGTREEHWINYPQNREAFDRFRRKLGEFHGCEWTIHHENSAVKIGPPIVIEPSTSPEKLAALKTAGVDLVPSGTNAATTLTFQIQVAKHTPQLKLVPGSKDRSCVFLDGKTQARAMIKSVEDKDSKSDQSGTTVFTLRSVEAILYFLGEVARRQLDGTLDGQKADVVFLAYQGVRNVQPDAGTSAVGKASERSATSLQAQSASASPPRQKEVVTVPLFVLERNASGDAAVAVSYDGARYSIPKGQSGGRSMHVLSLLTQLVALQNKGMDQPSTQAVRIVNP